MLSPTQILNYIETIVKYSNFSKAARKLYVSQPTLTQVIQDIERNRVGATIINRAEKPYSLTKAGILYCNYLREVICDKRKLKKELIPYVHPNQKIIRIGILNTLSMLILPELLPKFLARYPNIRIQLFENSPQQCEQQLLNEEIDCYIGQIPDTLTREANCITNGAEQYYVVIPSTSTYYYDDKLILDDSDCNIKRLLNQPIVLVSSQSAIRSQIDGIYHKFYTTPDILLETDNIITATNLTLHGLGITISTANVIEKLRGNAAISLYPIDKDIMQLKYFIATKKDRKITRPLSELMTRFQQLDLDYKIS